MLLTEVILRLRTMCPVFERRVGGTSSFSIATSQEGQGFTVPYCFVVPGETSTDAATGGSVAQKVTEKFLTIVAVDNAVHREDGNLTAADALEVARKQIRNALIGWEPILWATAKPVIIGGGIEDEDLIPNSRLDTFRYEGGQHLAMNAQRLWHNYEWSTSYYDAPEGDEEVRGFTDVVLNGITAVMIPKGATIAKVTSLSGALYSEDDYAYNPTTGSFARKANSHMPAGAHFIVWYEKLPASFKKIYAAYYPEALAAAGGDPEAITLDMYTLASELQPDGTVTGGDL